MSAANTNTTLAGYGSGVTNDLFRKKARKDFSQATYPHGEYVFTSGSLTVPTTAIDDNNDRLVLFQFPDNMGSIYILSLTITISDVDSGTAHVFNLETFDGTNSVDTYISGSTKGQAGGTDEMDADTGFRYHSDVKGKYLAMKSTTAAGTPVAGTVTVRGHVWVGDRIALS